MTDLRVLETPLLQGLLGFVEALRAEGLSPGQDQVQAWLLGLLSVPWEGDSFYLASRALLVGRKEDYAAFDRAFRRYFGWLRPEFLPQQKALGSLPLLGQAEAEGEGALRGAYSPLERLLRRSLESLTPGEALVLARFLLALAFPPPRHPARRRRRTRQGERLSLPATLRRALRTGGEVLDPRFLKPKRQLYRYYALLDVSGSMAPYARILFLLLQALRRRGFPLEAFAFGTRLTRITPLLPLPPQEALPELGRLAEDFAGGTRLGLSLRAFLEGEGRQLGRRSLLLVLSDGLDQGEPEEVGQALKALRRRVRRIYWLNPLAGLPGYSPLARGMRAALPYLDDLLPAGTGEELLAFLRRLKNLP
jgi:uncharacterized protein with von Willebrand factor type A (vWA) domain